MKPIALLHFVFMLAGCASVTYVDRDPSPLKSRPTDRSLHALFFGEYFRSYNYFDDSVRHPFHPYAKSFDPADAWWLAECSLLAYVPEKRFIRDRFARVGFENVFVFNRPGTAMGPDTQFFVASRKDAVIVSFRGSEPNIADWATNAKFSFKPMGGGNVHGGYLEALDEAWEPGGLAEKLNRLAAESPDRPIWFTGHSQGGALAVLAAARWFADDPSAPGGAYTFGTPRLGDPAFCAAISFPAWRIVHASDFFSTVPRSGYGDAGRLKWIDSTGNLHDTRGPMKKGIFYNTKTFFANLGRGRWVWLPRDIIDHSPLYYAILTYNRLQECEPRRRGDTEKR